jgi:molybdopterin converting factor small subunit
MKVRVLLFASYADAFAADSIEVETADGISAGDVLQLVLARSGATLPPRPMLAINAAYVDPATPVRAGDEVAIIPPVAGG